MSYEDKTNLKSILIYFKKTVLKYSLWITKRLHVYILLNLLYMYLIANNMKGEEKILK